MTVIDVVGWVAAGVGSFTLLPQLVKLLRTGNSAGVSLISWQVLTSLGIGWSMHGVGLGQANMIAVNTWMVVASLLVVRAVRVDRGLGWTVFVLPLALGVALVGVDMLFGPVVFGLTAVVPGVAGTLGQLAEIVRTPDLSGLSPVYLLLAAVTQGLWLTWGLGVGEVSTQISSSVLGTTLTLSFLWYVARRLGLPAFWAVAPRGPAAGHHRPASEDR